MKKLLAVLAVLAGLVSLPSPLHAQTVTTVSSCGSRSLTTGYANSTLYVDQTGNLCTSGTGGGGGSVTGTLTSGTSTATNNLIGIAGFDGTNNRYIKTDTFGNLGVYAASTLAAGGNVGSGGIDSGNPVKVGGVYNSTLPTFTTGQRGDLQLTSRGALLTGLYDASASGGVWMRPLNGTSGLSTGNNALAVAGFSSIGGSAGVWDIQEDITGAASSGVGTTAVASAPTSSANAAITPVVSAAVESSHVLKASAGNLYRVRVTTGASAGYLMVFNATTAPADGAVTPQSCTYVPATTTAEIDHSAAPDRYTTGISVAFSTTGCFTKTASATAMFEGFVE